MSKFGLESLSSSQVSRAAKLLDEELEAWRNRPLGEIRYLLLGYEKVPRGSRRASASAPISAAGCSAVSRHLRGRGPLACLPGEPRCPSACAAWPTSLRRWGPRARPSSRRQLAALPVPPGSERHPPRPQSRHPQAYRKGAAPGLGRRRPQGRRGRAGAPGGKLPRQGRQTRPGSRRDPRGPHRFGCPSATEAHANLEPHRAIHPAWRSAEPSRSGS